KGVLEYCVDPIVSSDIIGTTASSIFDSLLTQVSGGNFVKIVSWYDNENGYSNRMADMLVLMSKQK
nr:type I glyceraldehyde-3-phosphate dehydrogenase [Bacteroidales bacterium]